MELKNRVGEKSGPFRQEATEERLKRFTEAIGAQWKSVAPPTFMTTCRRAEFDLFKQLGFSLERVLHAEQEYFYKTPILPGDWLTEEAELIKVQEKRGKSGTLSFLTFETRVSIERGQGDQFSAGSGKTVVVVRS